MFGHAEPVIDRAIAALGEEPRRRAQIGGGNPGQHLGRLGAVMRLAR